MLRVLQNEMDIKVDTITIHKGTKPLEYKTYPNNNTNPDIV